MQRKAPQWICPGRRRSADFVRWSPWILTGAAAAIYPFSSLAWCCKFGGSGESATTWCSFLHSCHFANEWTRLDPLRNFWGPFLSTRTEVVRSAVKCIQIVAGLCFLALCNYMTVLRTWGKCIGLWCRRSARGLTAQCWGASSSAS